MPEQSNDYRVVVFGAAGVGKTSIVHRFIKGTYKEAYTPTVEDTYRQVIHCNKQVCTLQITDTTGSHQFPAMQRLSIEKGHAFILVYSINSRASIEELKNIYLLIREVKGQIADIPMIMVGNKSDESKREISRNLAEEVAKKWGCEYIETSAKEDVNIKEMIEKLLNLDKTRSISLQADDGKKKKKSKQSNSAEKDSKKKTAKEQSKTAASNAEASSGGASGKCIVM